MFSLTLDYDQGNPVSICGYSKLWRWSEGRVRRFLKEIGASIEYPENTSDRQNQRGVIVIVITEGTRRDNGGIKAIDSKWLYTDTKGNRSDSGGNAEGTRSSTIDPNPEPEPKPKEEAGIVPDKPSRPARTPKLSDEQWMEAIKANPAYDGIDIDRVKGKLEAWCMTNGKRPTRARLVNWLNREEKPLTPSTHKAVRDYVNDGYVPTSKPRGNCDCPNCGAWAPPKHESITHRHCKACSLDFLPPS